MGWTCPAPIWYDEAANQGNADAEYALGLIYYKGEIGRINLAASLEYFRRAMVNGNQDAIFMLGEMYYNGYEVDKDYNEAMDYYVEYERLTHSSDAQYMIGKMYCEGEGVAKNVETGTKWLKKAAEQGNEDAVAKLEEMGQKDFNRPTDVAFKVEPVQTNVKDTVAAENKKVEEDVNEIENKVEEKANEVKENFNK